MEEKQEKKKSLARSVFFAHSLLTSSPSSLVFLFLSQNHIFHANKRIVICSFRIMFSARAQKRATAGGRKIGVVVF
jgi:hypothetical protein